MAEEDDDKQHEATQKKLDDARKKGEIPRSADVLTTASYGGFLIVAASIGGKGLQEVSQVFAFLISTANEAPYTIFGGGGASFTGGLLKAIFPGLIPWLILPALIVLTLIFAQRGFVFAPDKIKPKLNRVSLLANAKNKFGRSGLFEFFKSFVKLMVYSGVLGIFLWLRMPEIVQSMVLSPALVTQLLSRLLVDFLVIVFLISASIGAIDFLWQRHEHQRKNRMSHKELSDETKQSEGDPHVKQQRRQKGYEIAMNQMLSDVSGADVIVVNPTHYAVALKWTRASGAAPVCVAKGVDQIAARIREVASENGVPIHRDPATARAIFAVVEIGHEIQPDHYEAVAAAIRFAEVMRKRARQSGAV
ncbi:MAG TPA: flagellar biosynthesis protein FlhB [Devosia sp.]|nr:flagellar biosynthesis protein FlhB [Devosia sp.]